MTEDPKQQRRLFMARRELGNVTNLLQQLTAKIALLEELLKESAK